MASRTLIKSASTAQQKSATLPVSYTHLDVYKRQLCNLFPGAAAQIA
ncbi:hypothetical protein [Erwinia amylovora]